MVTVMFELFYNAALNASNPEELSTKLYSLGLDFIDPTPPFLTLAGKLALKNKTHSVELARQLGANVNSIASGFALAGKHDMVELYRTEYGAEENYIALAYAFIANHKKVDEYLTMHNANIHFVLQGYAFANNHKKVNEYLANYHPKSGAYGLDDEDPEEKEKQHALRSVDYHYALISIAQGYALVGNVDKVEEYRVKGASVDNIARAFAAIGNHEMVEHYRVKHSANIHDICVGYQAMGRTIPSFYRAIITLKEHGDAGQIVIDSLLRLKQGQDQFWNPYWMNSGAKLKQIIDAVDLLPQDKSLSELLKDEKSDLYQALNTHRLSPITFLGQLGFYHSKSVQNVHEQLDKNQEIKATL
jgi:hypothetical protein